MKHGATGSYTETFWASSAEQYQSLFTRDKREPVFNKMDASALNQTYRQTDRHTGRQTNNPHFIEPPLGGINKYF